MMTNPKRITNIISYNTNGLRTREKRANILNVLDYSAFCFLQETHSLPSDNWQKEWAGLSLWSSHTNFSAGTAILLPRSAKIQNYVLETKGRFVLAKITHHAKPYTLCCVYAPDKPHKRPKFWKKLKREITLFNPVGDFIMAGDFNSVFDPTKDRVGGNPALPQHTCGNAELSDILDGFCLTDSCDSQTIGYTWKSEAKQIQSRLDRIYIDLNSVNKALRATKRFLSYPDHAIVSLGILEQVGVHRSPYWKLNTSVLSDPTYKERIEADILCHKQAKQSQNISQWWDDAKERFRETSIGICKKRNREATARLY